MDGKLASIYRRALSRFLQTFFWLLYHQFAWAYDWVAWAVSLGNWNKWVLSVFPYLSQARKVLEIGHGPGHLLVALRKAAVDAVGLDASRQMGVLAASRLQKADISPVLINGQAKYLPFSSNTFSHVVATFPTEYILEAHVLAEIQRVLISGGCLLSLPAAWITGARWFDRLAAWLFIITGQAPDPDKPDLEESMKRPFEQAGFITYAERCTVESGVVLIIRAIKR